MKLKSLESKTTVIGLLAVSLLLLSVSAAAIENYAQTGRGNAIVNSYGECWQSVAGASGLCGSGDADGDGVADKLDKCPETPKGVAVDAVGCPLDSDGDGVTDDKDQCPNTPVGATVDSVGCMQKLTLDNVEFVLNSSALTPAAKGVLDSVATALKGRPDLKSLTLVGHTDSTGAEAYNKGLSEARAASVAKYLRGSGVTAAISTSGMGEAVPVADNSTSDGRSRNRRVELSVDR